MSSDIYLVIEHLQGHVSEITYVLAAAARELAQATGGKSVGVLCSDGNHELAEQLNVDGVLALDHPAMAEFTSDAYVATLGPLLQERMPRAILFGDTSVGAGVAGRLSARLSLPLVSSCKSLTGENGKLSFVSQICGGKVLAEGELPGPTCLVTMVPGGYRAEAGMTGTAPEVSTLEAPALDGQRAKLVGYLEPELEDVDIAKEPILVAAGRGIQREDNLELLQSLAEAMGGVVCASRPVVDQNWLPTSRLVGKSGRSVKPKLYLALGISGAPEHAEGMAGSELIIAVNTDPGAPIFGVAHYGAEMDLLELVPLLTDKVREARGG